MEANKSKTRVKRKPKQDQEPVRRSDSQDNAVYLTPQHLIDQKVRRNCRGEIVRKKPITEDNNKPTRDHVALVLHTSGTTRKPKTCYVDS